ncbi:NAD(P)-binding protein [Streptomyces reniochalinae]|uniref:FAD-dependent oxidoreductase n=1 Tax=Streptomyces reniochalinae TaxID=2250578 RepID=A0A367EJ02_9ACTN|nr:NAD(P)-binding protein [Streptomyces reniochalinae]RCG17190.1 FAD-dependent oxidoreductase [Streptomyces reniochalinae]
MGDVADRGRLTVVGGGFGGLTAALCAREAGAEVTVYEARHRLGGRAGTAEGPYRTNEGPHALYNGGPHWRWLARRGLLPPMARVPVREGLRMRYHHDGALHRMPPPSLVRLRRRRHAPVGVPYLAWAAGQLGEETARAAANFAAVATFHHAPGELSAAFTQERMRRASKLPPEAHYPRGGWASLVARMAQRARESGVRVETGARIDAGALAEARRSGPVVLATSLAAARGLLGDPSLSWPSGRTALLDLVLEARGGDAFVLSDLDAPGWIERFTAADRSLAPAGRSLIQAQFPLAPDEPRAAALSRGEHLLDLGFARWRDRVVQRTEATAAGRTGAVDPPGTCWRDRPAIDRGDGLYLVGDQVASPGVLSEVSFTSAREAVRLALGAHAAPGTPGGPRGR